MLCVTRSDGSDKVEKLQPASFVPLIGAEGWSATERSLIDDRNLEILSRSGQRRR